MGDRVSVSFSDGNEESVVLFSHWGGKAFGEFAESYARDLLDSVKKNKGVRPLDRFEPNTVMLDFIREVIADQGLKRIDSDLYLGKTSRDGDNGDNGHFKITIEEHGVDVSHKGGF